MSSTTGSDFRMHNQPQAAPMMLKQHIKKKMINTERVVKPRKIVP